MGERAGQAGHLLRQFSRADRRGRFIAATGAGLRGEIEFTIVDLAHAYQALAQRIEPVGLGLQLAQLDGHRIDLTLRGRIGLGNLCLLERDLGPQIAHLSQGHATTGEEARRETNSANAIRAHPAPTKNLRSRWRQRSLGDFRNFDTIMTFMPKPSDMRLQGTAKASSSPRPALEAAGEAGLDRLIARAKQLAALDEQLRRCLPDSLRPHCRLGNVGAGKLVYLVDAPVWGTRLRQHADVLLDAAVAAGLQVGALTVKVSPPLPSRPDVEAPKPLSQATRDALRKTAESVADPELRAQLLRLASLA